MNETQSYNLATASSTSLRGEGETKEQGETRGLKENRYELPYEDQVEKWKVQTVDLYHKNMDKLEAYKVVEGWFISYKQNDGSDTLAERLYNKLNGNNWFDMMYAEERTVAAMIKGIMRRKKFICFLSPHYFASNFCVTELTIAFKGNRIIVPVYNQDKYTAGDMLNLVPDCFSDLKKRDFIGLFRDMIPCEGQIVKISKSGDGKLEDEFHDSDNEGKDEIKRDEGTYIALGPRPTSSINLKQSQMVKRGQMLIKYCSECYRSTEWQKLKTVNDCSQYLLNTAPISGVNSAHTGKLKPPMVKSTGVIQKPAEDIIKILSDVELRGVYNKTFKSGQVLEHYNLQASLRYETYQGVFPTMPRDFLLLHCIEKDPVDPKTLIIAQVSTQDSIRPKRKTYIRGDLVEAWFVSSLDKKSCLVSNIIHLQLGGVVGRAGKTWKSHCRNVEFLRVAVCTGKKRNE